MKHAVPHALPMNLVRRASDAALRSYQQQFPEYKPTATWVSDRRADVTFEVMGKKLQGGLDLTDRAVELELKVPMLMKPFASTALGVVEQEVKRWLDKARQGELDEAGTLV